MISGAIVFVIVERSALCAAERLTQRRKDAKRKKATDGHGWEKRRHG
jgi:hypothetical protein